MLPRLLVLLVVAFLVGVFCSLGFSQCTDRACPCNKAVLAGPDFGHGGPGPGPQPFQHGGGDFHGGRPDFHPDFHQGGWGYGGGWVNPYVINSFVAPVIGNILTAPREVLNPATGQYEMRPPGAWVQIGTSWAYQPLPQWPILSRASAAKAASSAPVAGPIQNIIKLKPIRTIGKGIINHIRKIL